MQTKKHFNLIFRDITTLGGIIFSCIVMLIFLFMQEFTVFFQLLAFVIISQIITSIIRALYFKKRPKEMTYTNWLEKLDASSFPSTHSQRAVMYPIILGLYFNNIFITILLVVIAFLIIYSRHYFQKHHLSDMIVGIIIGIIISGVLVYFI